MGWMPLWGRLSFRIALLSKTIIQNSMNQSIRISTLQANTVYILNGLYTNSTAFQHTKILGMKHSEIM